MNDLQRMEEFILPDLFPQNNEDVNEDLIKDEMRVEMGENTVKTEILENNQDLTSKSENSGFSQLNQHYLCEICYQILPSVPQLATHVKTHEPRPFSCQTCGAEFKNKFKMEQHVRVRHTRERPFKCPLCPKRFLIKASLKVHTLVHTGEKPYLCQTCGRGFGDRSTLSSHVRTQHNLAGEKARKKLEKQVKFVGSLSAQESTSSSKDTFSNHKSQITSGQMSHNNNVTKSGSLLVGNGNVESDAILLPFRCSTCPKSFMSSNILKKHLLLYHHCTNTPTRSTPPEVIDGPNCSDSQNLVKFIKTYSGKKYDKRRRGRSYMLFANGYTFHRSAVRASKTHWICSQSGTKFKCRAAAATDSAAPIAENSVPHILYIASEEDHKHPRPNIH